MIRVEAVLVVQDKIEVISMNQTLIDNSLENTQESVSYIDTILNNTIHEYSGELDEVMDKIYRDVISVDYPAIMTIEKYFLELSGVLYKMCERTEKLGVYDSISKSRAQETYNKKYLDITTTVVGKKPTVGESQAISEQAAMYDKTVNDIYAKAYKVLKNKVSAAETMVATLSKVLSHRVQESQMTAMQTGRQVLNEGNII